MNGDVKWDIRSGCGAPDPYIRHCDIAILTNRQYDIALSDMHCKGNKGHDMDFFLNSTCNMRASYR